MLGFVLKNSFQSERVVQLTLLLFAMMISSGTAILCWQCNSKFDQGCDDPFNGYSLGLVNCSQMNSQVTHIKDGNGKPMTAKFCRKMVQKVDGETRIIRDCGWLPNDENLRNRTCFMRTGTKEIQVHHCVCQENQCNGASTIRSSTILPFVILLIGVLQKALIGKH